MTPSRRWQVSNRGKPFVPRRPPARSCSYPKQGLTWHAPGSAPAPAATGSLELQMPRPFRTSCFSFFSLRFSLSVLPDFFAATFRGDLSAMSTPFLRSILLSFGEHEDTGGR